MKINNYAEALYEAKRGFLIIGLTGYTGSGCSTVCSLLKGEHKPALPGHDHIQKHVDERRYQKLRRIWETLEWQSFVDIEVSRVILMLAIHRAISTNFKKGSLAELRRLALPHKKNLKAIKYLIKREGRTELNKPKVVNKLLKAYKTAKPLYGQFKSACKYDIGSFIEVMQGFGDDIRKFGKVLPSKGSISSPKNMFVLPEALRRMIKAHRISEESSHFVIDAFRNPYEVEYFKRRYNEFYLVAIHRDSVNRRQSLQGLTPEALERLEKREKGQRIEKRRDNVDEWVTSQNIDECIQKADMFIYNLHDGSKTRPHLRFHLIKIILLAKNPGCIPPSIDERSMQIAITARQNSGCLSRHVGAVVVNKKGYVLGVGWNDPPAGQVSCSLRTGKELVESLDKEAFSEYERSHEFVEHIRTNHYADRPFCFAEEVSKIKGRKMAEFTRALHAEENALFQAMQHGSEAVVDATLYTTDSTCTLCAKRAYQLGIHRIVYIEEYPGIAIDQTLKAGNREIQIEHFEGITSSAYFRLFCTLLPEKDLLSLYE